jgi:hypothetical protein
MHRVAHHFLPSKEKKGRAVFLRHVSLVFYSISVIALLLVVKGFSVAKPGVLGYASNINANDLLKYTNEERSKAGLKPVSMNASLSKAASFKAKDMFKYDYWAHVSPSGIEPWHFFGLVGYDYTYAGENLAKNFSDSKAVVKAWMNSPSHRENMLNSNYQEMGFSIMNGTLNGYETTLVVQFFGTSKDGILADGEKPSSTLGSQSTLTEAVNATDGSEKTPQYIPSSPEQYVPDATGESPAEQNINENSLSRGFIEYIQATPNSPVVDLFQLKKIFAIILATFLLILFVIDYWYSTSRGVVKVNGNTLAHILLLIMTIVSIGVVIIPGNLG